MSIPSPADVGPRDPLNELIRITFDNAHDAIAVSDACGRLVEVNDRFAEIYGYTRHEAIGLGLIDLRSPGSLGRYEDDLALLADTGRLRFETEHRRRDGRIFPVEASVRQMTLNGALYRVSILRDVTERQEAQVRADVLTRLYGALQAANEALITSVARDELFARICRACVEYGLRMAWVGLIAKNEIHPDSFAGEGGDYLHDIRIAISESQLSGRGPTGTAARTGRRVICNDFLGDTSTAPWHERGRRFGWRASAAFPLFQNRTVVGVLTLYSGHPGFFGAREVELLERLAANISFALDRLETERRRREAEAELKMLKENAEADARTAQGQLRAVFEQAAIGIERLDLDGRFIEVNDKACEITGYSRAELSRLSFEAISEPEDLGEERRRLAGLIAGEVRSYTLEKRYIRKDGARVWVRVTSSLVRSGPSEPCFRVTVVEDISDRRRAEQALLTATDEAIRARAEAERAALTRSRFIAAASHDLRQPVQSLLLLIGVLKEHSAGMSAAQIAEHMERALDALKMLLNSILDVSKLDAGIIVPDIRDVPMSQLMDRLLEEYRWRAQEKRLDLRAVETTAMARTDSALIERMVGNLIENAIRYTPPGGKVLMGCRRLGEWLRIDVADNGIGISEDQHEAVFVEFHQIGNPERDRGQGIGLGLAIVRRIARLLGGDVAVSSTFGKGSRFSVTVPLSGPGRSGEAR